MYNTALSAFLIKYFIPFVDIHMCKKETNKKKVHIFIKSIDE